MCICRLSPSQISTTRHTASEEHSEHAYRNGILELQDVLPGRVVQREEEREVGFTAAVEEEVLSQRGRSGARTGTRGLGCGAGGVTAEERPQIPSCRCPPGTPYDPRLTPASAESGGARELRPQDPVVSIVFVYYTAKPTLGMGSPRKRKCTQIATNAR